MARLLGRQLRERRKARKLTIENMSKLAQLSTRTIQDVEAGRNAKIMSYFALAEALEMKLLDIGNYE